jgi:hypothetical protein
MIVKNEALLIERCLDSVLPLIDYAVIEDTGSTDGTQDIVRRWLDRHNVLGKVFDEPWKDFGHNRTVALQYLRNRTGIDYALVIDADDVLVIHSGFNPAVFKSELQAGLYDVDIHLGGIRYSRPQLFQNRGFVYRGVLHEYLEVPPSISRATVQGFHITAGVSGARSRNPDKYQYDALTLEQALQTETDPFLRSRYTFYLAQSLKDGGHHGEAYKTYLKRSTMGFWAEEVFVSLWRAAQLAEQLGLPRHTIIGLYLEAWERCSHRAESLHNAARYCRLNNLFHQGRLFAKMGLDIAEPSSASLFVEPWIYTWGLLDEYAVSAYWTGHYRECLDACVGLLSDGKIPAAESVRIEENARFAREALSGA